MKNGEKISEGIAKKLKEKGIPVTPYEINYYLYNMSDSELEELLK